MATTKKATATKPDQKKHLALYEAFTHPSEEDAKWALKKFNKRGFQGHSIHHQWRIQEMTRHFGPVGVGWGIEFNERWKDTVFDQPFFYVNLSVWYIHEGERYQTPNCTGGTQVYASGGLGADEAYKASETDAFGKCCQYLGLGAVVYMGQYDDGDKYTRETISPGENPRQAPQGGRGQSQANVPPEQKPNASGTNVEPSGEYPGVTPWTGQYPPESTFVGWTAHRMSKDAKSGKRLKDLNPSDVLRIAIEYPQKNPGFADDPQWGDKNRQYWLAACHVALNAGLQLPWAAPTANNGVATQATGELADPYVDDDAPF